MSETANQAIKKHERDVVRFQQLETLNIPYEPDTLASFAQHKIRRMMLEHYVKHGSNKIDTLLKAIRNYAKEKEIDLMGLVYDENESGKNNKLIVIQVMLEGTTYYKHIMQSHVDRYILELQQIKDNTTI